MLLLSNILVRVYRFFKKRKIVLFLVLLVWAGASGVVLTKLKFKEDINSVFPDDKEVQRANEVLKASPFLNRIYVVIKQEDTTFSSTEKIGAVADKFEEKISLYGNNYFSEIQNKIDDSKTAGLVDLVRNNLPYFLVDSDYVYIDSAITPSKIHSTFESGYNQLLSPAGFAFKDLFVKDPLGFTWRGMAKLQNLNINRKFTIQDGYLMSADEHNILIFLQPAYAAGETGKNKELVNVLERSVKETMEEHPGYTVQYFGAPVVSVANASQIQRDILLTVGLAFILLNIMLLIYFRRWYTMPLLFTPVIFGTITGLAAVTLIKGSISLIALGIGSVMMQLILDFAIHAYTHYFEKKNAEHMIKSISALLLATAGTTSMTFLCLLALKSNLLNDLGLFASISIISSALFTVLIFPQFLKTGKPVETSNPDKEEKTSKPPSKTSKILFRTFGFAVIGISIVSVFFANQVSFDANLDKFSYVPKKLQESENYLDKISDFKLKNVYLISSGKTFTEALNKNQPYLAKLDSLQRNGVIEGYTSINQLWPNEKIRDARLEKWVKFWTLERINLLEQGINKEESIFRFKKGVFTPFVQRIKQPSLYNDSIVYGQVKELVFKDLIQETEDGVRLITLIRTKEENKPALYDAFGEDDFVFDNKFIFNKLLYILQQDFQLLSWLSTLLVFIVVLLTFRRIELAIATMIPMMLGWTMTLGFMAILDIRLNIFNLIICTFIFGLGMDYSIFYGRGLLDKYRNDNKDEASFRISIILSLITTLLGMGVLIFAKHPALRSIGTVSVIGLFSVTAITFFIQPGIFRFLLYDGKKPRKLTLTPSTIFTTSVYFGFYIFNTIFMFIMALVLVKSRIVPKGLKLYEGLNSMMARITLGFAFVVKRNFRTIDRNVFKQPAIIVANHQSSLDIVIVAMLSGKIRIVTKKWVFNLPVIGFIAKTLQFYPSEEINEPKFVERAKKDIENGYFILFFAEGTRSLDQSIHRFKKGAFLLAEQIKADILPLLIHGTGVSMPSGTALIGPGIMQVKMLPLIKYADPSYPLDYQSKTKAINQLMRTEFYKFRKAIESWRFIKHGMRPVYIYRSPLVRKAYKEFFTHEQILIEIDLIIGPSESVSIYNPNYGEMAHYLYFRSAQRTIDVYETEKEKLIEIEFLKNWDQELEVRNHVSDLAGSTFIVYKCNDAQELAFDLDKFHRIIFFETNNIPTLNENWTKVHNEHLVIYERNKGI